MILSVLLGVVSMVIGAVAIVSAIVSLLASRRGLIQVQRQLESLEIWSRQHKEELDFLRELELQLRESWCVENTVMNAECVPLFEKLDTTRAKLSAALAGQVWKQP